MLGMVVFWQTGRGRTGERTQRAACRRSMDQFSFFRSSFLSPMARDELGIAWPGCIPSVCDLWARPCGYYPRADHLCRIALPAGAPPLCSLLRVPGRRVPSVKESEAVVPMSCTHGLRWLKERAVTFLSGQFCQSCPSAHVPYCGLTRPRPRRQVNQCKP